MITELTNAASQKMQKALEITVNDLSGVRSGRATPALVENIIITAYDGTAHLKLLEMATITTSDARTIIVSLFDPSQAAAIEKGIQASRSGLTPVLDAEHIRITIPPLSEERRQEYIKLAKAKVEAGRIMIRQIRHEAMKDLKVAHESKTINEDDKSSGEKQIQELTDKMIGQMDDLGKAKEQELLQL